MSAKLPAEIVRIATAEIGVEEINGTNCGLRVNEYKAATTLDSTVPWPWCAAFVCWVVREALRSTGIKETKAFNRPMTAGAWAFERWSMEQDETTNTKKPHRNDIVAGDIVVFKFSHIGFAISKPDANNYVQTIEGNTDGQGSREGGAVLRKKRHVSQIRSRIRLTL